jgi:hypothetical protein
MNLWEFPSAGDYAFNVPNEPNKIEAMVALGWEEFNYCHQKKVPFILMSHWHGLEQNNNSGYAVHEKLIPLILESGLAEPMSFSTLLGHLNKKHDAT